MAYVKGPVTSIESSASPIPCNLSVLANGHGPKEEEGGAEAMFGVIHKHIVTVGHFGSASGEQKLITLGKLEDKNPASYLTQVSS